MGVEPSSANNQLQQQVDISSLVDSYLRITDYIKPLVHISNITSHILSWEKPVCSLCVWVLSLVICCLVTSEIILWLSLAIIWLAAGVKMAVNVLRNSKNVTVRPDILTRSVSARSHQDVINDFHMLLQQLEFSFKYVDGYLHKFSAILLWSDMKVSLRWFGTLSVVALAFCYISQRIMIAAGVCYIFIHPYEFQAVLWQAVNRGRRHFYICMERLQPIWVSLRQKYKNRKIEGNVMGSSSKLSEEIVQDLSKRSDTENSPAVPNNENCMSESSSSDGRLQSSPTKTSVVNRIKSLRRRRDRAPPGSCSGCNIAFSSLLRKRGRVHCRHCGNQFCDKCCMQQVPRSLFGATAPAAQHETVPVCALCYQSLFDSLIEQGEHHETNQ